MDNLRGAFDSSDVADDGHDWDSHDEENVRDLPPEAIGQDERRMQVRAYNHWASLLGDNSFPSIEDLEPHNLDDFGPNSVLLDFSAGIEDPAVQYLGGKLAEECGTDGLIEKLSDVPARSLLSRITDHYMQILANEAPIGFEAEFVNQRGVPIMYRGILLPFSSDDETIDFIYGVINWKEMADQITADELLLEIDQALELGDEPGEDEDEPQKHHADTLVDAPSADVFELSVEDAIEHEVEAAEPEEIEAFAGEPDVSDNVASFASLYRGPVDGADLPVPEFGHLSLGGDDEEEEDEEEGGAGYSFASLADYIEAPTKKAIDLDALSLDASDYQPDYEFEEDGLGEDYAEAFDLAGFAEEDSDEAVGADFGDDTVRFAEPEPAAEIPEAVDGPIASELAPPMVLAKKPIVLSAPDEEETFANDVEDFAEAGDYTGVSAVADSAPLEPEVPAQGSYSGGLHDHLAEARELAETASTTEDRSRHALYAAVSRAYDFSIAAEEAPEEYAELVEDAGLTMQDRAPMTPVVKLVFGAGYDKTRLTEYAAVLGHAHRLGLGQGMLANFLANADGGLKGVVAAERRLRKEESGKAVDPAEEIRAALAQKLRELEQLTLSALSGDGAEFSLVMVRRDGEGGVAMVGEISDDIALIERAARKLVA